jgi:NitT/TauT family transport system substrate-binding protein
MNRRLTGMRRIAAIAAGLVSTVGLVVATSGVASASSAKAKTITTVNYGVVGLSASSIPLFVAQNRGFFYKNGLKVNLIAVGQSQPICQQLIANALQFGDCSLSDTIQARMSGGSVEIIDNEYSTSLPYDLVVGKSIKTWAQLKGQTIMLGGPRDNTVYYFSLMAKKAGYKLSDFSYTYAGSSADRFAALQSGSVAGTLLTLPFAPLSESLGYNKLSSLGKLLTPANYAGGGTDANIGYANAHPKIIDDYVKSYQEAIAWIDNPKNKAKVMTLMETDGSSSTSIAEITYDDLVKTHFFSPTGQIYRSALKGTEMSLYSIGFLTGKPPSLSYFYNGKFAA